MHIFGEILAGTMLSMGLGVVVWLLTWAQIEEDKFDESWESIMEVVNDA